MQKTIKFALADSDPGSSNAIAGVKEVLFDASVSAEFFHFSLRQNKYFLNDQEIKKDEIFSIFSSCKPSLLITGTSVESSLEYDLINYANKLNISSLAMVDHWVNYRKRFERNNVLTYPSFICVNDELAKNEAISEGIPEKKLKVWGHAWWYSLEKSYGTFVSKSHNSEIKKLLFLSDNLNETWGIETKKILGYTEFEILEELIKFARKTNQKIVIRLHPKEVLSKYDKYLKDSLVELAPLTENLWESASRVDMVVGMFSNSILEASFVNPNVFRFEPGRMVNYLPIKLIPECNSIEELIQLKENLKTSCFQKSIKFNHVAFVDQVRMILSSTYNFV